MNYGAYSVYFFNTNLLRPVMCKIQTSLLLNFLRTTPTPLKNYLYVLRNVTETSTNTNKHAIFRTNFTKLLANSTIISYLF